MIQLRCPSTGLPLRETSRAEAEKIAGRLHARRGAPFADADAVLLREDHEAAYPVVNGVPILLGPEILARTEPVFDLRDPRWGEAYDEMEFYNQTAADLRASISEAAEKLLAMRSAAPLDLVDVVYDAASQLDALQHLRPVEGAVVLQLGGSGKHAVKMLVAGASEAWLITPMLAEAEYGRALAMAAGFGDAFHVAVGIAEQIPIASSAVDSIYSGGCLHHMTTQFAGPEIRRVLKPGGGFAAVEPWQTAMHKYGTRLIGKREANAYCTPLNEARVAPLRESFPDLVVRHHGPVLRYFGLALQKFTGRPLTSRGGLRLTRVDDKLPLPKTAGGSVAVLASRPLR